MPVGFENFMDVRFHDCSQSGIHLPNPTLIALHAAVAHVLNLSGAADIIDKVSDQFLDEGPTVPSGNRASREDTLLGCSPIELTTASHQLPTNHYGEAATHTFVRPIY